MKKLLLYFLLIILALCFFACAPISSNNASSADSLESSCESDIVVDETNSEDESGNNTVSDETVSEDDFETNDGWKVDPDLVPIIEDFGKEIRNLYPNGFSGFFWNEELKILEAWMFGETGDEFALLRIKKSSEWEDITADLNIECTSDENSNDRELSGKKREGELTVTERMKNYSYHSFSGDKEHVRYEIWYDKTDKMTYAMLVFGENTAMPDPYMTFLVGTQSEVDFETFDEANSFLNLHNYHGWENTRLFMRGNKDNFVYVTSQSDDTVTVYYGKETDYIEKIYQKDQKPQTIRHATETTENGRTEITDDGCWYNEFKYDNDNKLVEVTQLNYNDGTKHVTEYENDIVVYTKEENNQGVTENWYTENGKTKKFYSKFENMEYTSLYKLLIEDGEKQYYLLSTEGEFGYRKYTYVSEDSPNLIRFESYSIEYDDHVIWTLDGSPCSDTMENVISLERTYQGKTTFYTFDEVPWGTGMAYPPHFQHELKH